MHDMGTQQFQSQNSGQHVEKVIQNGSSSSKPAIERGASWSYGETKILLALWGQDMVQRQLTNSKRTRHVWEKIAERIRENGYERTADQVRTRVFNMIAEYRRILKNPTPERKKKCIFFDALHKIYQAKDTNSLENAIMSYGDYNEQYNFDPIEFNNNDENIEYNGDDNSDNDERSEIFAYTMSPSGLNSNANGNLNDINSNEDSQSGHNEELTLPQPKRCRFDSSNITNDNAHFPLNSILDTSASALLIDRMFAHLSRETEVMREWVNLERERLTQEIVRRKEEKEREERREKSFLDVLTKLQDQVFNFLSKQQSNCTTSCLSSQNSAAPNNHNSENSSQIKFSLEKS